MKRFWHSALILCATALLTLGLTPRLPAEARGEPKVHPRVVLGGQAIGVVVPVKGLLVLGFTGVGSGRPRPGPAERSGVRRGDLLVAVDGIAAADPATVADIADRAGREGRPVRLCLSSQGRLRAVTVRPGFDAARRRFRLGLVVGGTPIGVGTLTFVDPVRRRFAALGHTLPPRAAHLSWGTITACPIVGIRPGGRGVAGRKIGVPDLLRTLGTIGRVGEVGIVGPYTGPIAGRRVALARPEEVHEGAAELWTVLHGERPEKFAVEIEALWETRRPSTRAFVLRVVDERLMKASGGIVQGMSGSPIVQDGKLVGALTHVFLNDPTRGLGALAWWMWRQSEVPTPPSAVTACQGSARPAATRLDAPRAFAQAARTV